MDRHIALQIIMDDIYSRISSGHWQRNSPNCLVRRLFFYLHFSVWSDHTFHPPIGVTAEDLQKHVTDILSQVNMRMLIAGNVYKDVRAVSNPAETQHCL